MINWPRVIRLEFRLLLRDKTFWSLALLLFFLMCFSLWNASSHFTEQKKQLEVQLKIVEENDEALVVQIDSLNQKLATYENEYTLPTSGVRLTYNNHRIAWMPFKAYSLIAIGQSDLYNNYKKIILYFSDSYSRTSKELVSPIEQLFGQLDLAFIWTYLLPLIVLLTSFNILSAERESGRLKLIGAQPIKLSYWLFIKIGLRFITTFTLLIIFTVILLFAFDISIFRHFIEFCQLAIMLFLYCAFWFFLSLLVNLLGYSSSKSLILLTNIWVLFVFLIPSIVNQLGKELYPFPSRLEMVNHHQASYNEMEANLDEEMEELFRLHPDWDSDDPVTKDMSNSTGWNINYLAKQYIAQLKHQPEAELYEAKIDKRNEWFSRFSFLSPTMIFQHAITDLSGTSTRYFRSFLAQTQAYTHEYRQLVFKGLFTNHAFTSEEIKELPKFNFKLQNLPSIFGGSALGLFAYLVLIGLAILAIAKRSWRIQ